MNATGIQAKLKAKGQAMTLTHAVAGVYDPVTGSMAGATTTTSTVYGITTNYSSITRLASANKPDSLILAGDKQAIIDAVSVVPVPGDTLTIAGEVWKIIAVDSVAPAGVAMLFKCQVRK